MKSLLTKKFTSGIALLALCHLSIVPGVFAQGTAFSYQGRLNNNGAPSTGIYDLQFSVYDAASSGNQIGDATTNSAVAVSNGLFTVTLDFGTGVFTGSNRWLEIATRTNGAVSFNTLSSRQAILSVPYAVTASNLTGNLPASQVTGVLNASQIPALEASQIATGTLSLSQLPAEVITDNQTNVNLTGTFSGNGTGLTNVEIPPVSKLRLGIVRSWGGSDTYLFDHGNVMYSLTNIVAISSSAYHTLALKSDGTVIALGDNGVGQCNVPGGLNDVRAIAAGYYFSLAVRSNGTFAAWGDNSYGELNVPVSANNPKAIAAGVLHGLAVKSDGTVVAWGSNERGEGNVPAGLTNVVAVSGGEYYSLALKSDGTVVGWGSNDYGTLNIPSGLTNAVAISSGSYHSLAIRSNGTVVGWGMNVAGSLNIPAGLTNVVAIAAGYLHSIALKSDGTVVAWGWNNEGQCNVPPGLTNVAAIAAGYGHSVVLSKYLSPVDLQGNIWPVDLQGTFIGNGNGLTNLTVANVTGTISDAQVSSNVALLNGTNIFTGNNQFTEVASLTNASNQFAGTFSGNGAGLTNVEIPPLSELRLGIANGWGGGDYFPFPSHLTAGITNFVAISCGAYHTLALKSDGTIMAWGDNGVGQINVPGGLNDVKAIAAGYYFSLAVRSNGTIVAWGDNSYGELNVPVSANNPKAIAVGVLHSLAVKSDGTVVAWGSNERGEINVPAGLTNVVAVTAGEYSSLALKSDGTVVGWGSNDYGLLNTPSGLTNAVAIASGSYHCLALKSNGTVVGWGMNVAGDLDIPAGLTNVVAIAAGYLHSMALKSDGTVVAWGWNSEGQCNVPAGLKNVAAISAGYNFSLVIYKYANPVDLQGTFSGNGNGLTGLNVANLNGTIPSAQISSNVALLSGTNVFTGSTRFTETAILTNANNQLAGTFTGNGAGLTNIDIAKLGRLRLGIANGWGGGDFFPFPSHLTAGITNFVAISSSSYHTLALKSDGTIMAWGDNGVGQINVPGGLNDVKAIAAGYYFSLAVRSNGTVVAWGDNSYGELNVPVSANNPKAIGVGVLHSLAVKSDGTVVGWGSNERGEINIPAGLTNVIAVSGGEYYSLALKSDGTVVGWGNNDYGVLNIPSGLTNAIAIASGSYHSLAIRSNGTVVAWGMNVADSLNVPAGLTNVVAIAAGYLHSLALKSDGTVVAWGWNSEGQCNVPAGLKNVAAISCGYNFSLVISKYLSPSGSSELSGMTINGTLSGNGNNLTNLSAINLTGTIPESRISSNVALLRGTNVFTAQTRFAEVALLSNANNQFAGKFNGNGSGLTNLNPANLTGTISDARLSENVALLNGTNVFTGTNQFAGDLKVGGIQMITATLSPDEDGILIPTSGYVKLTPASAVTLNAVKSIEDGSTPGQMLILEGTSDTNTVTIKDDANTKLVSDRQLSDTTILNLMWNGSDWVEISFVQH